jgi:uncharacterized protein
MGLFLVSDYIGAMAQTASDSAETAAPNSTPRQVEFLTMARILISGASGLLGSALSPALESHGYEVTRLVRQKARDDREIQWDPTKPVPAEVVSGFEAVIHLSGENIAGRWTEQKKCRIRDSRIFTTDFLAQALAKADKKPRTFICASAIGYYGNRGDEILTEESLSGDGFFPEVCREWESATEPASDAGIRVVNLRTGLVLSREGGALKQMLLPFRLGLGGKIGDGSQYWSWVHIDDFVSAVHHILNHENSGGGRASSPVRLAGPVNMTAPNPVTNAEFTRTLASALKRPALLPVPAFVARLAFGELADEGLLASARVVPRKLLGDSFQFQCSDLTSAFRELLRGAEVLPLRYPTRK